MTYLGAIGIGALSYLVPWVIQVHQDIDALVARTRELTERLNALQRLNRSND